MVVRGNCQVVQCPWVCVQMLHSIPLFDSEATKGQPIANPSGRVRAAMVFVLFAIAITSGFVVGSISARWSKSTVLKNC